MTDNLKPSEIYAKHLEENYDKYSQKQNLTHIELRKQFNVELVMARKWIRVEKISHGQRSIHAFIVVESEGKFNKGDILKPASWKSPSKNFSRGNVFWPDTYKNHAWAGL